MDIIPPSELKQISDEKRAVGIKNTTEKLLQKMKDEAENGKYYLDINMANNDTVNEIKDMLIDAGYKISVGARTKNEQTWTISWD